MVTALRLTIMYACSQLPKATGVVPGATSGICVTIDTGEPLMTNCAGSVGSASMIGRPLASLIVNTCLKVFWFMR
jgi:hypothetical protein